MIITGTGIVLLTVVQRKIAYALSRSVVSNKTDVDLYTFAHYHNRVQSTCQQKVSKIARATKSRTTTTQCLARYCRSLVTATYRYYY
jgi:hypothetical protein